MYSHNQCQLLLNYKIVKHLLYQARVLKIFGWTKKQSKFDLLRLKPCDQTLSRLFIKSHNLSTKEKK